jgi:bifunctional non-homologous end joining protein LigD
LSSHEPFKLTQCQSITLEEFARLDKTKYAMEPKVDGWRIQMEVTPDQTIAWTRTNHIATGKIPRAEQQLMDIAKRMKSTFRLDGEVVYLDKNGDPDFNFTSRCMGSGTDVCVHKQMVEERYLSYVVFDILQYDNVNYRPMAFELRRGVLDVILPESEYVPIIDTWDPSLEQHGANIEKFQEGSVLKLLNSPYAGKRHKSWLKMKDVETVDVTIIGYKDGQGKYSGLIGAIVFRAPDGTIGNCSGMDDATRVAISNHREFCMGKIIEVKHYGRLVDGYRHPQFIRFRDE